MGKIGKPPVSRRALKPANALNMKFQQPRDAVPQVHAGLANPTPPSAEPVQPAGHQDTEVSMYDWVRAGYQKKASLKTIEEKGWQIDKELSNHNQSVFWNPRTNHVVMSIAGTHNTQDAVTDLMVGLGQLKGTGRYKEAKEIYTKAQKKYGKVGDVIGHSLGGGIASELGRGKIGKESNVYTYNKAATPWDWGHGVNKRETAYRDRNDPVSFFATGRSNTVTFEYDYLRKGLVQNPLEAHSSQNLKNKQLFVG